MNERKNIGKGRVKTESKRKLREGARTGGMRNSSQAQLEREQIPVSEKGRREGACGDRAVIPGFLRTRQILGV